MHVPYNDLAAIEAQIVSLGERPANQIHHQTQAEIVRVLAPKGLAFEMIPRAEEDAANTGRTAWENERWSNWDDYRQILEAAPDARISGGGVDRDMLRSSVKNGAALAWGAEGARYRLDDPGVGLRDNGRRVLTYADLFNLHQTPDPREPEREIELHLTGNMSR